MFSPATTEESPDADFQIDSMHLAVAIGSPSNYLCLRRIESGRLDSALGKCRSATILFTHRVAESTALDLGNLGRRKWSS